MVMSVVMGMEGGMGEKRGVENAPVNWPRELLKYFNKEVAPKIEQEYSPEVGKKKRALITALGSKEDVEKLPERSYERWFAEEIKGLFELVMGGDLENTEKLDLFAKVLFEMNNYANTGLAVLQANKLYSVAGEADKADLLLTARDQVTQERDKQRVVLSAADQATHVTKTNTFGSVSERYVDEG